MSRRTHWRADEQHVITITPVARGTLVPFLGVILSIVLVQLGSAHVRFIHQGRPWFVLFLAGPMALIFLTRTWRWRSHKVRLSNQRVIVETGVVHHRRSAVELVDVLAIRVDQRVRERILKRGVLVLETRGGSLSVGLIRHPDALARLIEHERAGQPSGELGFDTVFDFDAPHDHGFDMNPRRRRGHSA